MRFEVHHFHHSARDAEIDRRLDLILGILIKMEHRMSDLTDKLDAAEAAAKADADAETAAMNVIKTLADQIAALKTGVTDPAILARIQALTDATNQRAAALAAAVVAGTPAA